MADAEISRARKHATLACLCFAKYFLKCCYSVISPFYPEVALGKGVNSLTVGFVLASFALVSFIVSPPIGKSMAKFGPKYIFCFGCGISGLSTLLFGCLDAIENAAYFVVMSFVIRTIQAFGVQACNTASIVIVFQIYRTNVAFFIGVLQIASGLGIITGPTLGGLLYAAKGYFLPFLALGGVLLLILPLCIYLFPEYKDTCASSHRSEKIGPLLLIAGIVLGMLVKVVNSIEITYLDSTLSLALTAFDVEAAAAAAFLFFLVGVGFGVSSPLWGLIGDRWHILKELNLIGLAIGAIGYFLVGPAPFLHLTRTISIIAVGLSIMGVGVGAIITIIPEMVNVAIENGYEDNVKLYGLVSGLYYFADNFGLFIGPIIGATLMDEYGFPLSSTIIAWIITGTCVLYAIYVVYYRCFKGVRKSDEADDVEGSIKRSFESYDSVQNSNP